MPRSIIESEEREMKQESTQFKPLKLLGEVMALAYLVNTNTDYCTFVRYSGHIEGLSVDICQGKDAEGRDIKLHDYDFYVDERHGNDSEKMLLELKSTLESYLYPDIKAQTGEVTCK